MPERRKEYSDDGPGVPPIDRNLYPYPTTDSLVYAVTFGSCVYATNDVGYAAWQRSRHAKTTKDSGKRESYDNGMVRDVQTGKPRFDLLMPNGVPYPDQLLTRFAELMARGAEKYSQPVAVRATQLVDFCTCASLAAMSDVLSTLVDFAEAATSAISVNETLASLSASVRTAGHGEASTQRARLKLARTIDRGLWNVERRSPSSPGTPDADSLRTTLRNSSPIRAIDALYAVDRSVYAAQTWTTTIVTALHEAFYVHLATKLLGCSETHPRLWPEHESTCRVHRLIATSAGLAFKNDRNWEKARGQEAYERARGSALRHMMQWYCGEDDEDHAAAVLFNITMAETLRYRADHESL